MSRNFLTISIGAFLILSMLNNSSTNCMGHVQSAWQGTKNFVTKNSCYKGVIGFAAGSLTHGLVGSVLDHTSFSNSHPKLSTIVHLGSTLGAAALAGKYPGKATIATGATFGVLGTLVVAGVVLHGAVLALLVGISLANR